MKKAKEVCDECGGYVPLNEIIIGKKKKIMIKLCDNCYWDLEEMMCKAIPHPIYNFEKDKLVKEYIKSMSGERLVRK